MCSILSDNARQKEDTCTVNGSRSNLVVARFWNSYRRGDAGVCVYCRGGEILTERALCFAHFMLLAMHLTVEDAPHTDCFARQH